MKKLFIVILALILLLGLGATLTCAKAEKIDLCVVDSESLDGGDVVGWVIANKNAEGEIIVEVHIQKGATNAQFYVFIVYDGYQNPYPADDDAGSDGKFMTNKQGNGNCHCTISSDNLEEVWLVVRTSPKGGAERYITTHIQIH